MRGVDCPDAVVSIVGGAHTETEGTRCPERCRPPVVVIVTITVHTFRLAEFLQFGLKNKIQMSHELSFTRKDTVHERK